MSQFVERQRAELRLLLRELPAAVSIPFVLSVFVMELLANKSISLPWPWLALDCGILVSWLPFLIMDVVTKHFGHKAANELSLLAIAGQLVLSLVLFIGSRIPGQWGEAAGDAAIGGALDRTFGGTWYILLGSALAFLISSFVNNFVNWGIGRAPWRDPDGFAAYAARSYVSTAVGQFADNLTFALVVSRTFFGWTTVQCLTCALTGMAAELLCQVLFSGAGYKICRRWKRDGVGEGYIAYLKQNGASAI